MVKWGLVFALLIGLLPSVVAAQDAANRLPPLAGTYTFEQSMDGQTLSGTLTIEGTGPIYSLTVAGGPGGPSPELVALAQGNILVSIAEGHLCAPAALLRQSDGSLFGVWIDSSNPRAALGLEHYVPHRPTKNFTGTYDFVGSYANGMQYTGATTIALKTNGAYDLIYTFTKDENYPDETPESLGTLHGTGLANGPVLGFSFTDGEGGSCGALVARFAPDGSYEGEFVTGSGQTGTVRGRKK